MKSGLPFSDSGKENGWKRKTDGRGRNNSSVKTSTTALKKPHLPTEALSVPEHDSSAMIISLALPKNLLASNSFMISWFTPSQNFILHAHPPCPIPVRDYVHLFSMTLVPFRSQRFLTVCRVLSSQSHLKTSHCQTTAPKSVDQPLDLIARSSDAENVNFWMLSLSK